MVRSVRARIGVAFSLSLLVLGALVGPTSAAVHTRWVDDDSKKGDGPASCDTAHFHTIQSAIDASSAGDQVFVCPGSYSEQLIIETPNLLIQAKPTRTAKIVPPEADQIQEVENGFDLVDILANGVSLVGFKMNIPAGDLGPGVLPSTCMWLDSAIYADANNVSVKANTIKAVGDNSFSGECGYGVGIGIVGGPFASASHSVTAGGYDSRTSDISRNRVEDFKLAGVLAEGALSVRIYRNSIRFVHANDPATCVLTPVLGIAEQDLTFPCAPPPTAIHKLADGPFDETAGIVAVGALADLRGNSIYSTFDLATCFPIADDPCPVFLSSGITMVGEAPGSIVRNNRADSVGIGLAFGSGGPVAAAKNSGLPDAPDGAQVTGNRLSESFIGLLVEESNGVYYGNRAHDNFGGAVVDEGGNVFDSNDFRYNLEGDCIDETTGGTGTDGTDNNWDAVNYGNNNEPSDICLETSPF